MIPNHAQFIDAIRDKKLVRIVFYSLPDAGKVDRECVPLDYGPEPGAIDALNHYWIWDEANTAGKNPLGLLPAQIVELRVLGKDFDPGKYPLSTRPWSVPRNWNEQSDLRALPNPLATAK